MLDTSREFRYREKVAELQKAIEWRNEWLNRLDTAARTERGYQWKEFSKDTVRAAVMILQQALPELRRTL